MYPHDAETVLINSLATLRGVLDLSLRMLSEAMNTARPCLYVHTDLAPHRATADVVAKLAEHLPCPAALVDVRMQFVAVAQAYQAMVLALETGDPEASFAALIEFTEAQGVFAAAVDQFKRGVLHRAVGE